MFWLTYLVLSQRRPTGTTTWFLWASCPSCHSTYSVKALQENPVVWSSFVLQTWYQHPMMSYQQHWRKQKYNNNKIIIITIIMIIIINNNKNNNNIQDNVYSVVAGVSYASLSPLALEMIDWVWQCQAAAKCQQSSTGFGHLLLDRISSVMLCL